MDTKHIEPHQILIGNPERNGVLIEVIDSGVVVSSWDCEGAYSLTEHHIPWEEIDKRRQMKHM